MNVGAPRGALRCGTRPQVLAWVAEGAPSDAFRAAQMLRVLKAVHAQGHTTGVCWFQVAVAGGPYRNEGSMQRTSSNASTRSSLVAFLHEHLGTIERNDVGPLIGQAALIQERGAASVLSPAQMQSWLNVALASDAAGEPGKIGRAAPLHGRRHAPVR